MLAQPRLGVAALSLAYDFCNRWVEVRGDDNM